MIEQEKIIVVDFGGQYTQLIARKIREANVYSEVVPQDISLEEIEGRDPEGIILSGGPASVFSEDSPTVDRELLESGIPVLGICYGLQLIAHLMSGGKVASAEKKEYGEAEIELDNESVLFEGLPQSISCWMSHGDRVLEVPEGFKALASSSNSPAAAIGDLERKIYGVQFHPEVSHTPRGQEILENFLYSVCGCEGNWTASNYIEEKVEDIESSISGSKVVCGLSGGVDSAVAAALTYKAIGSDLKCILVDHGLLRKDEVKEVRKAFEENFDLGLNIVDAQDQFLRELKGIEDPEKKRNIIGDEFIEVFEEEAGKIPGVEYLVQGTIYSDVIESGESGQASTIKSHHNVGGLPEEMGLDLVEPNKELFKDEVRKVGEELGLPAEIVHRQPFPGPGLAVRIMGDITPERLKTVQEADDILREEIDKAGLKRDIWQYFAVLTGAQSVGVAGDERTYGETIAIRAVKSEDAMTADWAEIPYSVLGEISRRITNEVENVNRVVYDITSKPPATIEWE